jgi:hypothetical protein
MYIKKLWALWKSVCSQTKLPQSRRHSETKNISLATKVFEY